MKPYDPTERYIIASYEQGLSMEHIIAHVSSEKKIGKTKAKQEVMQTIFDYVPKRGDK